MDNFEVTNTMIAREFAIMFTANSKFFSIYTNEGQLLIYSASTWKTIKGGLIIEGVCFLDSNEEASSLAIVTLKGQITFYRVKNPDYPTMDSLI